MHSVIPAPFAPQVAHRTQARERLRNGIAASFSSLLIMLIVIALALPNWYLLKGGGCSRQTLGAEEFFYAGSFKTVTVPSVEKNVSYSMFTYYGLNEGLKDCVTPEIVVVQRVIIALCFLTIFFSLCQFYFDVTGVTLKMLKCTKRSGLGSILSVITIVVIIGLCYHVSELMERQQEMTKLYPATRIEIAFGMSYYLIAAAGIVAVLATASNLFRCDHLSGNSDINVLLDDQNEEETFSFSLPNSHSFPQVSDQSAYLQDLPPPPPYTP
ncbi:transmembrane protein 127-like [Uloborus diversus]|uniref:transmembrane protein 127-like n=1 Tax=Uloborus diversus TaxID=327109 RepID=UPI0024098FF3|nr:transmembrane protein 127-like [Uloborus diversus]